MKLTFYLLIILNPFAQVLYLSELMKQLSWREFVQVHIRASLLSFGVFALFAVAGDFLLQEVFQVRLASLQIFGGLIILFIAHRYFTEGASGNLMFRGELSDLAPQITLPFMVGPGTIWVSMMIGRRNSLPLALTMIAGVLVANVVFLAIVQRFFGQISTHRETMLGKYFGILMRTNTLFIGAIAVDMILTGLETAFPSLMGSGGAPPVSVTGGP